jgi:hypothetical protein
MSKISKSLLGSLVLWASLSSPAAAAPAVSRLPFPLQSEEAFLKAIGYRAVPVADGVYEVKLKGETVRVAFGESGREFDRSLLRDQLAFLEAERPTSKAAARLQESEIRDIRGILETFETHTTKAATTGWVGCISTNYDYTLDGLYTINPVIAYAQGTAQIGLELDFGPYPEWYPDHAAGVVISVKTPSTSCYTGSDYDLVDNGTHDYATATQLLTCGDSCLGWRVLSYVDTECSGTYRSITRSGGQAVCS